MINRRGFSLIELIIAVGLLAVLTFFTSTSIRNSMRSRKQLRATLAMSIELRDASRIIQMDVNRAFHFRDLDDRLIREAKKEAAQTKQPTPNPAPGSPAQQAPPLDTTAPGGKTPEAEAPPRPQFTHFIGTENTLNFTSLGHVRKFIDKPESDQEEVGYELKECLGRLKVEGQRPRFNCLWRRTASIIDEDITEGGDSMILLENVKDFKLRYLGSHSEEWLEQWRTDERGEPEQKDIFPEAVEITLSIQREEGKKMKTMEMKSIATIHFPNNEPAKPASEKGNRP